MLKQIKTAAIIFAAVAVAAFAIYLFFTLSGSSSLTAVLPKPSDRAPYMLIETKDGTYPSSVSAFLTDGIYAPLKEGTPRNVILSLAEAAADAAVLLEEKEEGAPEVYAALRFSSKEMKALVNGELPEAVKAALKSPVLKAGAEKGTWLLHTKDSETPIFCKAEKSRAIFAADEASFRLMQDLASGRGSSIGRKKWKEEKNWPSHIEICDGGLLTSKQKRPTPLTLEAAWHKLEEAKQGEPTGTLRWRISGLDGLAGAFVMNAVSPKKWDTANSFIPEPLLLSMGINMPQMKGSPEEWPFPLGTLGALGKSMNLSDKKISKILAGQTIFSLGGQNRLLWFTLPGFMVEFTGEKGLMKELVDSFWDKMFMGTRPTQLEGFEFGGAAQLPFSVIGAGRDNIALLGLASPASINTKNKLGRFLKDDEKAVGWLVADLPRIGAALSDMTKMNSFMEDESEEDDTLPSFGNEEEEGDTAEMFQPEMSFSPFDQGVTDSFGSVLKKLGKVVIVWEKPDTGRLEWYSPKAPKTGK